MAEIKNETLKNNCNEEIARIREAASTQIRSMRERAGIVDESLSKLSHLNFDWFGTDTLYIRLKGETKADFSRQVTEIAEALGEPPEIRISPRLFVSGSEYSAEFEKSRVHAYLGGPADCKMIEVEETVTTKRFKPHPECTAALKALEDMAV